MPVDALDQAFSSQWGGRGRPSLRYVAVDAVCISEERFSDIVISCGGCRALPDRRGSARSDLHADGVAACRACLAENGSNLIRYRPHRRGARFRDLLIRRALG
jgi:hypothetical protein